MKKWKRWSGEQRLASLKLTKEAIARGEITATPPKCEACGQDKGILQWHNTNYDHPVDHLKGLCWRCHMVEHSEHFAPKQVQEYRDQVAMGAKFKPIYKPNFFLLEVDNNIVHPSRRKF